VVASIDTSRSPNDTYHTSIASVHPPIEAEVALDGKGWQVVKLFHHANIGGFLHLPLESGKCNASCIQSTSRTTPSTIRGLTQQHMQPIETKNTKKKAFYRFWLTIERGGKIGEWKESLEGG
jgi:hypothetical protein